MESIKERLQGTPEYDHQKEMAKVDDLRKTLSELKEKFAKTSVRCHMLQVDLATQFSPYTIEMLENATESCERCGVTIDQFNS